MTSLQGGPVPDPVEFARLCEDNDVVAVTAEVPAGAATPASLFSRVGEHDGALLLESLDPETAEPLLSVLLLEPWAMLTGTGDRAEWNGPLPGGAVVSTPLATLRSVLGSLRVADQPGMARTCGVAAGYIGYDAVREVVDIGPPQPGGLDVPDVAIAFPRRLVVFDHGAGRVSIVVRCTTIDGDPSYDDALAAIDELVDAVTGSDGEKTFDQADGPAPNDTAFDSNIEPQAFEAMIETAARAVKDGLVRQVVPSQRFSAPYDATRPFGVYLSLRTRNPAPWMFFLRMPGVVVAGASPQELVQVLDGRVVVRPIAGTRLRRPGHDEDVIRELLADEKERRELAMLVELAREEVASVADPASIEVAEEPGIRRLARVIHMTGEVTGELREGKVGLDALLAALPAGTVSGTPKTAAMRLLTELEPERRGIYGGCVGWFAAGGDLDTFIAIRTAVLKDGTAYVQAGAGVVDGSTPSAERAESENKARGVLAAVRAVQP